MRSVHKFVVWSLLAACTTVQHEASESALLGDEEECAEPLITVPERITARPDDSQPVRDMRALGAAKREFDRAALPNDDRLRARSEITRDELRSTRSGSYAELELDGATVRIVNARSPRTLPEPRADLVLDVGGRDLLGLGIVAGYKPTAGGAGFDLSIEAEDDGSGAGPGVPVGPGSITMDGGCIPTAMLDLLGHIPKGMPAIHFPALGGTCTDLAECIEVRKAWAHAHVEIYWAYLMLEYIDALPTQDDVEFAWQAQGRNGVGNLTGLMTAPKYWFGEYNSQWFGRIHQVVTDLWGVYRSGKHGSKTVKQTACPSFLQQPPLCYASTQPSANHFWRGQIDLCERWFERSFSDQVRLTIHESAHHLFAAGLALIDNQTHGHGSSCLTDIETDRIYGEAEVHHLATYYAPNDKECLHRDIATRTTDAYAQMIHHFGQLIVAGTMVKWPAPGDPSGPPDCKGEVGVEGCPCAPVQNGDAPDGDWLPSQFCPDNDGEMSCVTTTYNANNTFGVCTKCNQPGEGMKPAGCECTKEADCALGLTCYGYDTHGGGGVGHCYSTDGPPEWQCAADCQRLTNDPQAICANNYPGGAHCFAGSCTDEPDYMECPENGTGVCRDDECGAECVNAEDCFERGYPPGFLCIGSVCRFPS